MRTRLNQQKAEEQFEAACTEELWRPSDNDGSCQCHTNPPCSWCVNEDFMEGFEEWCQKFEEWSTARADWGIEIKKK